MRECGDEFWLTCTCCGEQRSGKMRCKRRWCPECQPGLSMKRMARWGHAIETMQWPLFLTLTMPNSEDPESLRILRDAWGKLRRRKLIHTKIKGGVATFEVTNKGNGWHPHIHAVADCRWLSLHVPEPLTTDKKEVVAQKCKLAQQELSALWADVLGVKESVVWIQRVKSVGTMAKEVLKYCLKGSELIECEEQIAPLLRVIQKTRMLSGWGSLHPLPKEEEEDKPSVACDKCGAESAWLPNEVISYLMPKDKPTFQPACK